MMPIFADILKSTKSFDLRWNWSY